MTNEKKAAILHRAGYTDIDIRDHERTVPIEIYTLEQFKKELHFIIEEYADTLDIDDEDGRAELERFKKGVESVADLSEKSFMDYEYTEHDGQYYVLWVV